MLSQWTVAARPRTHRRAISNTLLIAGPGISLSVPLIQVGLVSVGQVVEDHRIKLLVPFRGVGQIVVVGRGWADGVVELRDRFGGQTRELAVGDSLDTDIAAALID